LTSEIYITASCTIADGCIIKDGHVLFEGYGHAPDVLIAAYQQLQFNYARFYKMDNLAKLGWLASEVLISGSFEKDIYEPEETGVILANSNSSLDDDLKYFDTVAGMASPSLFVYTLPNIVIGEICIRNHFKGEQGFYISDKFEPGFIAQQVAYLLDNDIIKCCICGWVDILADEYSATLFLVEKSRKDGAVLFSKRNMDEILKTGK
jgi:hypothetical protein